MYHGWAGGNVPAADAIEYYERVTLAVGGSDRTGDFFRLFLVPGMGHCSGGDGPNTFDTMSALEQWVELGKAPEQMIASKTSNGVTSRTRPLCPYPQTAKWNGSGSTDLAANFVCAIAPQAK